MIKAIRNHPWFGPAIAGLFGLVLIAYLFLPREGFGAGLTGGQFMLELLPAAYVGVQALCLVLIYRTARVINFAQVVLGVIAQQLFFEFYTQGIMPYPLAWFVALIGGTAMVLVVGILLSTLFFKHPRLTLTVVTVFVTFIVRYASDQINGAFHPPGESYTPIPVPLPGTFEHSEVATVSGIPIRFAHLIGLVLVAVTLAGLAYFFRRSRIGIAIRASAENADRASLLGINVKLINVIVWGVVGLATSVVAVAQLPVSTYTPGQASAAAFDTLLPAMCAAVLARFMSLPSAFLLGAAFHLLSIALFLDSEHAALLTVALALAVLVGLLLQKKQSYSRLDDSASWKAVREVRPTPRELLRIPSIRNTRRILVGIGAVLMIGGPWIVDPNTVGKYTTLWIFGMVLTSLVVLTGWTGQISLGHSVLLGAGAVFGANATATWGLPFLIAVPLGGIAGALIAIVIGLPALRVRGLFLAVATFAVAAAFPVLFLSDQYLASWIPLDIVSPRFFGIGFESQRFIYFFTLGVFVIIATGVRTLRRSRAGRLLIAIRDNEPGVQAFGVDVVRTRLMAFAISGFIAAFVGAIFVHIQRGLDQQVYGSQAGFLIFQLVIIGGVSSVAGAFLGGLFFSLGFVFFPALFPLITGAGGLILLMIAPGGLAQLFFGMRDAVLRVVAIRRHIIVPSLFADYSPEAWEKRLTPLSPGSPTHGLGALPADRRYALDSRLHGKKVAT